MQKQEIEYQAGSVQSKGFLAMQEEGPQKRPAVIIAPAWRGLDEFARNKAEDLARLGYIGFAADIYGDGTEAENDEQAASLMKPLFIDRKELRQRIIGAFSALQNHPSVDNDKIAAIGFCFGGLTVIELLRSGVNVKGVVSLHGVLGNSLGDIHANCEPLGLPLKGSLLLLHGYNDPLVSPKDLIDIQKEFSDAQVDWQLHVYGKAAHAFTNPHASDQEHGLIFNAQANRRAWISTTNFLKEMVG